MQSILVSSEWANYLNRLVQDNLGKHLFLTCYYEPTIGTYLSWDAKYLIAVQNLYKFAMDSGCIIKDLYGMIPSAHKSEYQFLRESCATIDLLRAVVDHNQSAQNDFFDSERIYRYREWVFEVLQKEEASKTEDYQRMYEALEKLALTLCQMLEKAICYLGQSPQKDSIIDEWERKILAWYARKREIYLGQLASIYDSNVAAGRKSEIRKKKQYQFQMRGKLDRWIERSYLERLRDDIEKKKAVMPYVAKQSRDKCRRMIEEKEEQLASVEEAINNRKGATNYLFDCCLKQDLQELMKSYTGSMLPSELLQADIQRRFDRITADDFDAVPLLN